MKKISVTGTKGKTTTVYLVADILQRLHRNVLKVDTTGHFINGVRKSTLQDSQDVWGLVPSVCPGRYLYEFSVDPILSKDSDSVAVLECSLGCSSLSGMGYARHRVGVFLNVFDDHLGSSERLKVKEDIAIAKSFIFQRIGHDGWAVPNADDSLVVSTLESIADNINARILPFGLHFKHYDVQNHLQQGGGLVTVENDTIVYKISDHTEEIVALAALPWTFNGTFKPSVYNLMAAVAAIIAEYDGVIPHRLKEVIPEVRLDPRQGRLVLFESAEGVKILADYAHEKISMAAVGDLARSLTSDNGQVIGVVRLAYDRTDELIQETGEYIADKFDAFVVYDKIDGYFREPKKIYSTRFVQVTGKISKSFAEAISSKNPNCTRIIREDYAAEHVAKIAQPGDVVVYIVNDIDRSLDYIKKYFKAELV